MNQPKETRSFADLLRQHRTAAGLTQEELAERAGLSRRGIADLERGARSAPYAVTVQSLAGALGLIEADRAELMAAARAPRVDALGGESADTANVAPREASSLYRRVFVGRTAELQQLWAACDRAVGGAGELVLVVGEPGIGKTTACGQLARYAASRGMATYLGHLYEEGFSSLPYLPFVEALRDYVLGQSVEQLHTQLGSSAPEVARIVPELCERLQVEPRQGRDPEEDRWRLLTATAEFLRAAAAARPLMLVLEDLQWADRGTLDLLLFLSRRLAGARLLIVCTYRDVEVDRAHPLSAALVELRRGPEFTRVLLRGLNATEVQHMLAELMDPEVQQDFATAVQRQTEGNPLFIQEVVRYLVQEGADERRGQWDASLATRVPEGVRDVIGRRLSKLSVACNQALSAAAVIGRQFGFETLQHVVDLEEDALLAALEEGQRARVLDDASTPGEARFRFNHALFRQTLYEELFAPRRLRLHQRVARVLEAQYQSRLEEHAADLSEHFAQSSDAADLDRARSYAELAATRATRVSAYGEAVRHLRTALHLLDLVDSDSLEKLAKRCDLLLALGQAMIAAGEGQAVADQVGPEAFGLAERLGDHGRTYRACRLVIAGMNARHGFLMLDAPELSPWLDRMARAAHPGSAERILTDVGRAGILRAYGRAQDARELVGDALQLARDLDEMRIYPLLPLEGWNVAPHAEQERLELANELLPTLDDSEIRRRCLGHFHLGDVFLTWGDRSRAEALWKKIPAIVEQSHLPWLGLIGHRARLLRDCLDGELLRAAASADAVEQDGDALGAGPFGRATAAIYLRRTHLYLGQVDQALDGFSDDMQAAAPADLPVFGFSGIFAAQLALCLAHAGRMAEAQAIVHRFMEARPIGEPDDETPLPILIALLEAAVTLGDTAATRRIVEPLKAAAHLVAVDNSMTVVARHLGAAMRLLDNPEQARVYTRQAIELADQVRFRPELALARLQLADLLAAPPDAAVIKELESMRIQPQPWQWRRAAEV